MVSKPSLSASTAAASTADPMDGADHLEDPCPSEK
jgi:hypothetical protein